jgi:hypothetical protein
MAEGDEEGFLGRQRADLGDSFFLNHLLTLD